MGRKNASWLCAIALCLGVVGCGDDDGGAAPVDAGGDGADAGDAATTTGIDCSGASAAEGETPAVQTCGIASCHNPDFAGQRMGMGFAASNLTPDETGLAEWTIGEIAEATLDGTTPEGEVLCSLMIRYRTAGLSEAEACDIAAYLKALEPIENEVPDTCE